MKLYRVIGWTVLSVALATSVSAQRFVGVATGRQVRIVSVDGTIVTGEFVGLRSDTALIAMATVVPSTVPPSVHGTRVGRMIALDDIQSYAIRVRSKHRAVYGALVGGGLGLALLGVARKSDRSTEGKGVGKLPVEAQALARPAAVALTVAGALVGAAVGREHWGASKSIQAALGPSQARLGIALSVRF